MGLSSKGKKNLWNLFNIPVNNYGHAENIKILTYPNVSWEGLDLSC